MDYRGKTAFINIIIKFQNRCNKYLSFEHINNRRAKLEVMENVIYKLKRELK